MNKYHSTHHSQNQIDHKRMEACRNGDLKSLQQQTQNLDFLTWITQLEGKPLFAVAENNQVACLKFILEQAPSLIDFQKKDSTTSSMLHISAYHGYVEFVTFLLQKGASVHQTDSEQGTALHDAAALDEKNPCILILIEAGANLDAKDLHGWTPLHWAVDSGSLDNVKTLIQAGADLNSLSLNDGGFFDDSVEREEIQTYLKIERERRTLCSEAEGAGLDIYSKPRL